MNYSRAPCLATLCAGAHGLRATHWDLLAVRHEMNEARAPSCRHADAQEGLAAEQRRGQGHEQQAHALVHHDAQVQQQVAGAALRPLSDGVRQRVRDACTTPELLQAVADRQL